MTADSGRYKTTELPTNSGLIQMNLSQKKVNIIVNLYAKSMLETGNQIPKEMRLGLVDELVEGMSHDTIEKMYHWVINILPSTNVYRSLKPQYDNDDTNKTALRTVEEFSKQIEREYFNYMY